ncbi:MAG: adenylate/guanylate cyclase domain-containing protein [Solirubrobacterales bacterium]
MTEEEKPRKMDKAAETGRRLNQDERLLAMVKRLRDALPGDSRFGDPLSLAGPKQTDLAARRITELSTESPGVLREAGLSALQVWQAFSESQGRGRGDAECAIVFTDLVEFSSWAVEVGDEAALELLRDVGEAIEPPVSEHRGKVVKRLGDGMMAIFSDPNDAIEAVLAGRGRLEAIEVEGYRPVIRAGIHVGKPRLIGGDYLGIDVNVAARVAEAASGNELLVTEPVVAALEGDDLSARKKRLFRGKGVPKDLNIYSLEV